MRFEFERLPDGESDWQTVVRLPDAGVVMPFDLVFPAGHHLFTVANHFDHWIEVVEALKTDQTKGYDTLLVGHGYPAGFNVIDGNIEYLRTAKRLHGENAGAEGFAIALKAAYLTATVKAGSISRACCFTASSTRKLASRACASAASPPSRDNCEWDRANATAPDSHSVSAQVFLYTRPRGAREYIDEIWDLLEERFFEPEHGLYKDEIAAGDWVAVNPYRGQNCNMHMCEVMLAT